MKRGATAQWLRCTIHNLPTKCITLICIKNQKFWEELTVYFPLIRDGPHRKQRVQLFFNCLCICCAVTFLPSRCVAKIEGYTYRHRMGGIYEVRRWDGLRCHDIPSFMKVGSGIQKLIRGIHRHGEIENCCLCSGADKKWRDGQVNRVN
jgi:hypothetical protein